MHGPRERVPLWSLARRRLNGGRVRQQGSQHHDKGGPYSLVPVGWWVGRPAAEAAGERRPTEGARETRQPSSARLLIFHPFAPDYERCCFVSVPLLCHLEALASCQWSVERKLGGPSGELQRQRRAGPFTAAWHQASAQANVRQDACAAASRWTSLVWFVGPAASSFLSRDYKQT